MVTPEPAAPSRRPVPSTANSPIMKIVRSMRRVSRALKGQPSPGNRKGRRMRLVGSFGRVKKAMPQKKVDNPETNCRGPSFLLLHSNRDGGIYDMGIP